MSMSMSMSNFQFQLCFSPLIHLQASGECKSQQVDQDFELLCLIHIQSIHVVNANLMHQLVLGNKKPSIEG